MLASASWSGPLPPPNVLAKYNDAFPGCSERIVSMAEGQMRHRQRQERRDQVFDFALEMGGLVGGFLLAAGVIVGGVWLVARGKSTEGFIAIGTAVAAVIGAAWYARRKPTAKKTTPDKQPVLEKPATP